MASLVDTFGAHEVPGPITKGKPLMYPPPVLEMLAPERQRELLVEAARERPGATTVGHKRNWWMPIATTLVRREWRSVHGRMRVRKAGA